MIIASHVIFTTYGFWLPNDPRGSWSDFVRSWEVLRFGPATKTTARRSLARDQHDVQRRLRAKQSLKYAPVQFTGKQALAVARAFAEATGEASYHIYACSILPDHVHLVLARHGRSVEQIVQHLKGKASSRLRAEGLHSLAPHARPDGSLPSPWVRGRWKVFLDQREDVHRAIGYVEENPVKERKKRQRWSFVEPYRA